MYLGFIPTAIRPKKNISTPLLLWESGLGGEINKPIPHLTSAV
jgi:hypothetical protein